METNAISGATASQSSGQTSLASQDFETFLKLLTTQIQNQDPLSPLDTEDFASQLATFSMVEQQTLTNRYLESLLANENDSDFAAYSKMIGLTVDHSGAFGFSGASVELQLPEEGSQGSMFVNITNEAGRVVRVLAAESGAKAIVWDGLDEDGNLVEFGSYDAGLVSVEDGQLIDGEVHASGTVAEVRFSDAGVQIVLADGSRISETEIAAIKEPAH